jgi:HPr kinase/phosphorylase
MSKSLSVIVHASCVALDGKGVLLLGASGAAKSDLSLRLIHEGAKLVADDRTVLTIKKRKLVACAPASILGLLEVRGLGIVALPAHTAPIALVVQLGREGPRLPTPEQWRPEGLKDAPALPLILLNGRNASDPAKIALALRAFAQDLFRDTFLLKNKASNLK